MGASVQPPIVKGRSRRVLLTLATVLVLGGGLLTFYATRSTPLPPDVPLESLDSELANAISRARQLVLDNPRSGDAWGFLAKLFMVNGLDGPAEVCLHRAEELDGNNPRWPYYLALLHLHINSNTQESIACFRRAIRACDRHEPGTTSPHLQLAALLLEEGQDDEVEELLQVAQKRNPNNPQTIYLSALLLANRNDLQGSIGLLQRLKDISSAQQKVCTKLAQLYLRLGDSKSSQRLDSIARSMPEDEPWPDTYTNELQPFILGREQRFTEVDRLQKQRRYAEAVAMLQTMIANSETEDGRTYSALGVNLVHAQRGPEAEAAFEKALRLAPDDAETYYRLALVRFFQGEMQEHRHRNPEKAKFHYDRALASAEHALRITPSLGEAHLVLGQILFALKRRSEGIAALQMSLRSRPDSSQAHFLLGKALAEEGKPEEARRHLLDAIRFSEKSDTRAKQALDYFDKTYKKDRVVPAPETRGKS